MNRPPVYNLEVVADRSLVSEVLKGVLYTIFFHRFFSSFRPKTRDLLDLTLPSFDDPELDALINQRTVELLRSMEPSKTTTGPGRESRGQLAVQFYEKRLRKASWVAKAEEKVSWEQWMLTVTLLAPCNKTEKFVMLKKIESQLEKTLREIVHIAGHNKDHIPPITSQEPNPFPYSIVISPKDDTWSTRIGIF